MLFGRHERLAEIVVEGDAVGVEAAEIERVDLRIADAVPDFVRACEAALSEQPEPRQVRADVFLRGTSWDRTWAKTSALIDAVLAERPATQAEITPSAGLGLTA